MKALLKNIISWMLVGLLILGLASCVGNQPTEEQGSGTASTTETTAESGTTAAPATTTVAADGTPIELPMVP